MFDIAHPSHAGDFHFSPSETGPSITKPQVTSNTTNTTTKLDERMVNNIPRKQCPTCYGLFFVDEIAVHADLCTENVQRFSFLGLMKTSLAIEIPDISDEEISSVP